MEGSSLKFEEIPCPLCGTHPFRLVHQVQDRLRLSASQTLSTPPEETFRIVACSSCGFLYLNPRPKAEFLSQFYDMEGYDPHRQSGGGITGTLYRWVRPFSVGYKAKLVTRLKPPGTLLDVGCGSGEFLSQMKELGWEVLGIEQDPKAAAVVQTKDVPVLVGDPVSVPLPGNSFDVISMWHSLEHLPFLRETLQRLVARLEPQGLLVIAVPNPESWEARFYGSRWVAWDAPRHLYHFRCSDLENLMSVHGLELKKVSSLPLDPFYHSLLSALSGAKRYSKYLRMFKGLAIGAFSFGLGLKPGSGSSSVYFFQKQ